MWEVTTVAYWKVSVKYNDEEFRTQQQQHGNVDFYMDDFYPTWMLYWMIFILAELSNGLF